MRDRGPRPDPRRAALTTFAVNPRNQPTTAGADSPCDGSARVLTQVCVWFRDAVLATLARMLRRARAADVGWPGRSGAGRPGRRSRALMVGVFVLGTVARRVRRSGRPIWVRWPGRGRCMRGIRGCSSRRCSTGWRICGIRESAASGEGGVRGARACGGFACGRGERRWGRLRLGSRTGRASRRCGSACRSGGGSRWRGGGSGCGRWRRRSWAQEAGGGFAHGGGYDGPLAVRQGNRCARTWRRRSIAWPRRRPAADGVQLLGTSGFRSDAARAVLFARHPDPKWVAPPGKSLHRYGTELDLGPPPTMAGSRPTRRAPFLKRYEWEYVTFRSGAAMLSRAER